MPKVTTPDIDSVLEKYPGQPQFLISLMQDVQSLYNYISPEHLDLICTHVGVPRTRAWSVATFYKSFSLEPKGEHEIKVCLGTACHVRAGDIILENFERKLGIVDGETTPDREFSIERVACVGCCALAPVAIIGETVHGHMAPSKVEGLLTRIDIEKDIAKREKEKSESEQATSNRSAI